MHQTVHIHLISPPRSRKSLPSSPPPASPSSPPTSEQAHHLSPTIPIHCHDTSRTPNPSHSPQDGRRPHPVLLTLPPTALVLRVVLHPVHQRRTRGRHARLKNIKVSAANNDLLGHFAMLAGNQRSAFCLAKISSACTSRPCRLLQGSKHAWGWCFLSPQSRSA
jgi:hypothetical protein